MKKGSLTHSAASSREAKKTSLGHAHVGVGSDAWDSLISLCSTVPSSKWVSIQPFSPTFPPYFPPFFNLFSQGACLPFFLPPPVSSAAKKPACLRMALAGNSVGILQLPEHTQNSALQSAPWVCTPCPWLLLATPLSRIKQGARRCSLVSSQQLCLQRVKTRPGFFLLLSLDHVWSSRLPHDLVPYIGGNYHCLWILICRDQRAECKGLPYRNQCLHQRSGERIRKIICLGPSRSFCLEKIRKSHILSHIANSSPLTSDWAKILISTDLF